MSGLEHIKPKHETAKLVFYGGLGVAVTLVSLWALGVFSSPEPVPEPPTPPAKVRSLAPLRIDAGPVARDSGVLDAASVVEPPPPAPAPTTGTLSLRSTPTVEVFAGERSLGRTPLEIELDPGQHKLRLVDKRRQIDRARTFTIEAGRVTKRKVAFGLGTLVVEAPEGTRLWVNGRSMGRAPFSPMELRAGNHRLRARYKDKSIDKRVAIPAGRTYTYTVHYTESGAP